MPPKRPDARTPEQQKIHDLRVAFFDVLQAIGMEFEEIGRGISEAGIFAPATFSHAMAGLRRARQLAVRSESAIELMQKHWDEAAAAADLASNPVAQAIGMGAK